MLPSPQRRGTDEPFVSPERLRRILRVLEQRKNDAHQRYLQAEVGRSRITDQIAAHQRRLDPSLDTSDCPPGFQLVLATAHYQSRQRLMAELEQLDTLLERFDREELTPKREAFARASRKAKGFERMIERREADRAHQQERKERAALDEAALRRWLSDDRSREP